MAVERQLKPTDPFVLRPDVDLVSVRQLPDDIRERLGDDDAYAVARQHSRLPASLVDSETAALLEEFRQPATIVEAVLRYSLARHADPEAVLDDSLPVLARMIAAQDLVHLGADMATRIDASLAPGDVVEGYSVVRCIQLLDDTEVYEVRRSEVTAALKLARSPGSPASATLLREAKILRRLDGAVGPRCLALGHHASRIALVVEWCPGVNSEIAARALRDGVPGGDRPGLLRLVRSIVAAFKRLHDNGILHGDIQPNNVLVEGTTGDVSIIDFGLARMPGEDGLSTAPRGGVGPFLDPEYARASLASRPPPPVSPEGEQYSLAALLYFLVAGTHYCDIPLDRHEMFQQISTAGPVPFIERGAASWPSLENALRYALHKEPQRRFGSLAQFAAAIDRVTVGSEASLDSVQIHLGRQREALMSELVTDVGVDGPVRVNGLGRGPTVSLNYGAAGIAYGLYRMAAAEASSSLLAMSDYWSLRALRDIDRPDAFLNAELDITPQTVGRVSPFHTATGVYAVRALIDHALGDVASQEQSTRSFLEAADAPCKNLDLTLGRSGVLLAASLVLEATREPAVEAAGVALHAEIQAEIGRVPEIGRPPATREEPGMLQYLGIAHGWAGVLFSELRWCQATRTDVPAQVRDRLGELRSLARQDGDGWRWPVSTAQESESISMPGWCHGSAGYVFLWTLAADVLGRSDYLELAAGAARWALAASATDRSLCCGLAGRAYSLLAMFRASGEDVWLDGARALAARALQTRGPSSTRRLALYKGDLGLLVLLSDLVVPQRAVMPFFESEGWPPTPNDG